MSRKAKETHIFYVHGSGEIQVRSWHKGLNNAIRKLQQDEPQSVWIDESNEPGYLQAAVKVGHLTFRTVRSPNEKSRVAQSAAGKRQTANLRHQKEKAPPQRRNHRLCFIRLLSVVCFPCTVCQLHIAENSSERRSLRRAGINSKSNRAAALCHVADSHLLPPASVR